MICGRWSPHSCRRTRRTARAGGRGCPLAARYGGSCLCSKPAAVGMRCPACSAAGAGARAGGGSATGKEPGSGRRCIGRSATVLGRSARSIGRASWSIARACAPKRGRCGGAEPDRSGQAGHHASSGGRAPGAAAGRWPDRRGAPRRDGLRGGHREHPTGTRVARATAPTPGAGPRRQGRRCPALPAVAAPTRDYGAHRPQRRRGQVAVRPLALGGGAHLRLVEPLSPPGDPLRAPRGPAPGLPRSRLRPDLPQGPTPFTPRSYATSSNTSSFR